MSRTCDASGRPDMRRHPVGSYEETRLSALKRFDRLSPARKLRWLSAMIAFVDRVNPQVRSRRLGLMSARRHTQHGT